MNENKKTTLVTFEGDLGLAEAPEFESKLPDPAETSRVVLNLSNVTSIDSAIIAVIMVYRGRFVRHGHDPLNIVIMASPQVERLLDMTGTSRALTVLPASDASKS